MQLILPEPMLRPCWEIGTIKPMMYSSSPAAFFTTLPTTRASKEGKGAGLSLRARPVWFGAWLFARPLSPTVELPIGVANEATMLPFASRTGKSCAQVMVFAGIWRIVLQGTTILMPLIVTVPPQRMRSVTAGQRLPSSVAAWMKPVESNCGVGDGFSCAPALPAHSKAAMSAVTAVPSGQIAAVRGCKPRRHSLCILYPHDDAANANALAQERSSAESRKYSARNSYRPIQRSIGIELAEFPTDRPPMRCRSVRTRRSSQPATLSSAFLLEPLPAKGCYLNRVRKARTGPVGSPYKVAL